MTTNSPQLRDRRVVAALIFLAAILAGVTLAPIMLDRRGVLISEQMLHQTQPVHEATIAAGAAMLQQQASERGYLISGDERFLNDFRAATNLLENALDTAEQHLPPNQPQIAARVRQVRASADVWRTEVAEPRLAVVHRTGWQAALDAEASGVGEQRFSAFRKAVDDLSIDADALLRSQDLHAHHLRRWLDASVVGLGMAGLLGLALLTYVIHASLALQTEAEHARALNRQKDDFLSLVGHEIRTPVTVIRLIAESIRRRQARADTLDAWTGDRLHTMERQAQRISWLVDQLLDVGSAPGGIELARHKTDAVALTLRALKTVQDSAPSHPFHFNASEPSADAELDDHRVEQVLTHMIGNAVKFSAGPRAVRVHVEVTPEEIQWTVADQGVGIPRRDHKKLFQRFYRASNAPATGAAGIGLGLHLSQVIASAHEGRIWFESTPHRGSTFHLALPRHPRERAEAPPPPMITPTHEASAARH
jgi:signal transduction histidine kinase